MDVNCYSTNEFMNNVNDLTAVSYEWKEKNYFFFRYKRSV